MKSVASTGRQSALLRLFSNRMRFVDYQIDPQTKKSRLSIQETDIPQIKPGEVLLKVCAAGVNRADLLQKRGKYDAPEGASQILGLEAAGLIVGADLKPVSGKRYGALLPGGGYGEYVAVKRAHLVEYWEGVSWAEAGSIPEVWLTAFALSKKTARVARGQRVYVNAAAGSVGQSLVQLCSRVYGAEVYVSASSEEKVELCKGLGASGGSAYRGADYKELMRQPLEAWDERRGFDVAFDAVGPMQHSILRHILGMDSKWVLYGLLSGTILNESALLWYVLKKRISLIGFNLRFQSESYKSELVAEFASEVLPLLEKKQLVHQVDQVFEIDWGFAGDVRKVEDAHHLMENNKNRGKLVLQFQKE